MMKVIRYKWYAHFEYKGIYYCDPLDAYKQEKWKAIGNLAILRKSIIEGTYVHTNATFDQADNLYLNSIESRTVKYQKAQEGMLRNHLRPFFEDFKLININDDVILKYKDQREVGGTPKSTLQKEMATIRDIIQCVNKNYQLPKLEYKNKGKKTKLTLKSMDDVKEISKFVKKQSTTVRNGRGPFGEIYYQIYWIFVYTGMDTGDALKLTPNNIDFKDRTIRMELGRGKTGVEFSIPISPPLMDILQGLTRPLDDDQPYFKGVTNSQVNKAISKAFLEAGFGAGGSKMFRHFIITLFAKAGTPEAIAQKIVGHCEGSDLTRKVYTHVFDEDAREHYDKAFGGATK